MRGFFTRFVRRYLALLILCGGARELRAANTVTTNQIGQGVVYFHYHYDSLDGGPQEIYVADINLSDPGVSIAFPFLTADRTVSAHAATVNNAAVAVNGQFFNSSGAIQFLKVNGTTIYTTGSAVHDEQAVVDDGFHLTNSIRVVLRPGGNGWASSTVSNIMSCGVGLVQNGAKITGYDTNDPYITQANPRTCVAQTYDNHLLLMCVDGRSTSSVGMTIPQLRDDIFTRGSISNAFGLDGGGSTTMWTRSFGVVNSPSDGVARAVVDAVVIKAAPPAIPAAPTNFVVNAANTNISLGWAFSSGAMSYHLKSSTNSGGPYTQVIATSQTSATNTGLAAGTTYYYVVSAVNLVGESSNSIQVSAITIPPVPVNLTATPANGEALLNWSASRGATSYRVSRSTVSGGSRIVVGTTAFNNFTNSGLTNGTTYYYVIAAINSSGLSVNSAEIAVTPQCFSPGVPVGVIAATMPNGVALQWQASTNAQSYVVNRATSSGGPYSALASGIAVTNYADTTVGQGTVYFYTVTASNNCNVSAPSVEVSGPLQFIAPVFSSSNIVLRGWGGAAGGTYYVRASGDVSTPLSAWPIVTTNTFGPGGAFAFTNAVSPASARVFYTIQTSQP